MNRIDRIHYEYAKELRISEHRRKALFASLALNVALILVLVF